MEAQLFLLPLRIGQDRIVFTSILHIAIFFSNTLLIMQQKTVIKDETTMLKVIKQGNPKIQVHGRQTVFTWLTNQLGVTAAVCPGSLRSAQVMELPSSYKHLLHRKGRRIIGGYRMWIHNKIKVYTKDELGSQEFSQIAYGKNKSEILL